jgi:imidazolonepropionase-like amidohydrolase
VIEEGIVTGPSIYGAGKVISQTGGHSDAHRLPREWIAEACKGHGTLLIADGVDECLRAVRRQLRDGAKVIKVCASGGVVSEADHPFHQQFNDTELRTIVDEANRAQRVVAAHCHGRAGITAALRAGCRTIEHGSELDEETAELMREAGAILVPTRSVFEGLQSRSQLLPPAWRDQFESLMARHAKSVGMAVEHGVTIAMGTDLGLSIPGSPLSFGAHGGELPYMTALGLSPAQAIEAGTANAPLTLGPQAPASGQLAEGYDADVLAVARNPLEDISVLAQPEEITHVWKFGALVKSPEHPRTI